MDPNRQQINEIAELTRENNKMLHAMRRSAFFWGVVKFVIYFAIFVGAPLWLYHTYKDTVNDFLSTADALRQSAAQAQPDGFEEILQSIQSRFPSLVSSGRDAAASSTSQ